MPLPNTFGIFCRMSTPYEAKDVRRIWICLECSDEPFCGPRYRVETHLVRDHHPTPEESPFYCSMCHFCCLTQKELANHLSHYKPHGILCREVMKQFEFTRVEDYFTTNLNPIKLIHGVHLKQLSREESTL